MKKRLFLGFSSTFIFLVLALAFSNANAVLPQLEGKPIKLEMHTPLDTRKTEIGSPFEMMTKEPVPFEKQVLPENTLLFGHIISIRPSKRLGRPAYFKVQFDAYALPDHAPINLPANTNTQVTFAQNKEGTVTHAVAKSMILQHTSLLISIPAAVIFGLSAPAIVLVDSSADVVIGGIYGYRHKAPGDTRPTYVRVAGGVFRAVSSIPIASDLWHKSPDIVFKNGDIQTFPLKHSFIKNITDSLPDESYTIPNITTTPPAFIPQKSFPNYEWLNPTKNTSQPILSVFGHTVSTPEPNNTPDLNINSPTEPSLISK